MSEQTNEIMQALGRIEAKLDSVVKDVQGNGQPGLLQKVESLQESKNRLWGAAGALGSLGAILEYFLHRGGK